MVHVMPLVKIDAFVLIVVNAGINYVMYWKMREIVHLIASIHIVGIGYVRTENLLPVAHKIVAVVLSMKIDHLNSLPDVLRCDCEFEYNLVTAHDRARPMTQWSVDIMECFYLMKQFHAGIELTMIDQKKRIV
jgi:hypothetical protein